MIHEGWISQKFMFISYNFHEIGRKSVGTNLIVFSTVFQATMTEVGICFFSSKTSINLWWDRVHGKSLFVLCKFVFSFPAFLKGGGILLKLADVFKDLDLHNRYFQRSCASSSLNKDEIVLAPVLWKKKSSQTTVSNCSPKPADLIGGGVWTSKQLSWMHWRKSYVQFCT